jgi:ribokinase
MSTFDVIGLGALNTDRIYLTSRTHDDSEAVVAEAGSFPGGSAANTIYGLARLGVSTGFVGAIGDDAEGKEMLADFAKVGVDTGQISLKQGVKTGSALCFSAGSGKRSLYIIPGANNLLAIADIDFAYLNQAKVLHISSFADDRQFRLLLELMDKLTARVSFSPGGLNARKGLKALAPILARTHVLFLNKAEIQQLAGRDFAAGAETCLRYGCQIVVVTLGKGVTYKTALATSYIRDAKNEYIVESGNKGTAPAVDTTGAGDAFATGFLYGFVKDKGLKECGQLGDIVARFSIGKIGARAGLLAAAELSRRYHELYG